MSDIVSRLRASAPHGEDEAVLVEAAMTIEQLRAKLLQYGDAGDR